MQKLKSWSKKLKGQIKIQVQKMSLPILGNTFIKQKNFKNLPKVRDIETVGFA